MNVHDELERLRTRLEHEPAQNFYVHRDVVRAVIGYVEALEGHAQNR